MARSPASAFSSRSSRLWPTALVLAFLVFAAGALPVERYGMAAVVLYGAAAVVVLWCLDSLRRAHRDTVFEVLRREAEVRERDAEMEQRDAQWQIYVKSQAELVREEAEFTVATRLPAALARTEVPKALHGAATLGEGLTVWFDRLLTEVSEAIDDREESQRLALVELASRVQTSAHRIQARATGMAERYPGDSDLLDATMQVDHAATQQARHAQSLKVLCGEWPGQQWPKPLALVDVVRAASGRIVAYQRVEVTGDPDVGIAAVVVEPLIHLLAELLANATEYSPPKTTVPVTVRTVQRGAVIEVDDGGLGLDEHRMEAAREIVSGRRLLGIGDIGEIPQTGFAVVGRFARRHGFGVDMGPSPYGGVRAVVLVPMEILEALAPAGAAVPRPTPPRSSRAAAIESMGPSVPAEAHLTAGEALPAAAGAAGTATEDDAAGAGEPPAVTRTDAGLAKRIPKRGTAADGTTGEAGPAPRAVLPERLPAAQSPAPAAEGVPAPRRTSGLPQRRSVRGETSTRVQAAPTSATPPGSPEQAGAWMAASFDGVREDAPGGSAGTDAPPAP